MYSYSLRARSFAAGYTCPHQRAVATAAQLPVRSRQYTVAVRASKVSVAELRNVAEKAAQAGAEVGLKDVTITAALAPEQHTSSR